MPSPVSQYNNQPQNNIYGMLDQIKRNPMSVLGYRYNIPAHLNNPNDIMQYLLNTNQITQQELNSVMQMAHNNPQQILSLFRR